MSHLLAPGQEIRFLLKLKKVYGKTWNFFVFSAFITLFSKKHFRKNPKKM